MTSSHRKIDEVIIGDSVESLTISIQLLILLIELYHLVLGCDRSMRSPRFTIERFYHHQTFKILTMPRTKNIKLNVLPVKVQEESNLTVHEDHPNVKNAKKQVFVKIKSYSTRLNCLIIKVGV